MKRPRDVESENEHDVQLPPTVDTLTTSHQQAALEAHAENVPHKVIILLDVDGVVNLGPSSAHKLWSDAKQSRDRGGSVTYSPTMIAKINEWSKVAEIKWLTCWGDHAPLYFAPVVGLNAFPALPFDIDKCSGEDEKVAFAKQEMDKHDPDTLMIWLDDKHACWLPMPAIHIDSVWDIRKQQNKEDIALRPNSVYISPRDGLTPYHLEVVDKCLAAPWLAKGKMIYELGDDERGARTLTH